MTVNAYWYHKTVSRLREFFVGRGFLEIHPHPRQSFLAVADDVSTIMTYSDGEQSYLLPQTAYMWTEFELLKNPDLKGVFCCSTSYRQHQNPIPGRHENVFPMFDFEMQGGLDSIIKLEKELLAHFGFDKNEFVDVNYQDALDDYGVYEVDSATEMRMGNDKSNSIFLKYKPESVLPYWGVKRENKDVARTADLLLFGMGTIGSSERSCDVDRMRTRFYEIDGGSYAKTLFNTFGQERVERELGEYLSLEMFPRSVASIGISRFVRALRMLESKQREQRLQEDDFRAVS